MHHEAIDKKYSQKACCSKKSCSCTYCWSERAGHEVKGMAIDHRLQPFPLWSGWNTHQSHFTFQFFNLDLSFLPFFLLSFPFFASSPPLFSPFSLWLSAWRSGWPCKERCETQSYYVLEKVISQSYMRESWLSIRAVWLPPSPLTKKKNCQNMC